MQARGGTETPGAAGVRLIDPVLFWHKHPFLLIRWEGSSGGKGNAVTKSFPDSSMHVAWASSESLSSGRCTVQIEKGRLFCRAAGSLGTEKAARVCLVMNMWSELLSLPNALNSLSLTLECNQQGSIQTWSQGLGTRVRFSCCHFKRQIGKGSENFTRMIGSMTNPLTRYESNAVLSLFN